MDEVVPLDVALTRVLDAVKANGGAPRYLYAAMGDPLWSSLWAWAVAHHLVFIMMPEVPIGHVTITGDRLDA